MLTLLRLHIVLRYTLTPISFPSGLPHPTPTPRSPSNVLNSLSNVRWRGQDQGGVCVSFVVLEIFCEFLLIGGGGGEGGRRTYPEVRWSVHTHVPSSHLTIFEQLTGINCVCEYVSPTMDGWIFLPESSSRYEVSCFFFWLSCFDRYFTTNLVMIFFAISTFTTRREPMIIFLILYFLYYISYYDSYILPRAQHGNYTTLL